MKQLNTKQKTAVGFVAAIVSAAVYILGGIFGWWPSVIKPDEPAAKDPAVAAVEKVLPDVKEEVKANAPEKKAVKKTAKKAQKKAEAKK